MFIKTLGTNYVILFVDFLIKNSYWRAADNFQRGCFPTMYSNIEVSFL